MDDAVEVGEDRDTRLGLHARHQRLAAPRDDDVDVPPRPFNISPTAARSLVGTRWIASSGKPAARSPSTRQAWINAEVPKLSEPPRRIAALPP